MRDVYSVKYIRGNSMVENTGPPVRVRMPRGNEILAVVEATLGANKLKVRCQDEKYRIGRIPGKMKKRIWMREGDVVLTEPWDIQGDKFCNVIWKYTPSQADWLRNKGILNL